MYSKYSLAFKQNILQHLQHNLHSNRTIPLSCDSFANTIVFRVCRDFGPVHEVENRLALHVVVLAFTLDG